MKAEQDRLRNLVGVDEEGVDLAFCKSLRQACRSPKPNIDEIECLSLKLAVHQCLYCLYHQLDNFRSWGPSKVSAQGPKVGRPKITQIVFYTVEGLFGWGGKVFTGNGHGLFMVGDSRRSGLWTTQ